MDNDGVYESLPGPAAKPGFTTNMTSGSVVFETVKDTKVVCRGEAALVK